jgi:hypothetical protein
MPGMEHTCLERVRIAVHTLATSASPIQTRLLSAGITLSPLKTEEFRPGDERQRYERIMLILTERAAPQVEGEGTLEASTRALSDEAAQAAAEEIWELHREVSESDGVGIG